MRDSEELSYSTCRGLLASGVVGRVAVATADGPRVFTVNHAVVDESIVFRTDPGSLLGSHVVAQRLAFQMDSVDYTTEEAWSVQAVGTGELVEDPGELAHIGNVWQPTPWAGGDRPLMVRLVWDELTGRKLGLGPDPKGRLPGPTGRPALPFADGGSR